jgi:hypothetical protein
MNYPKRFMTITELVKLGLSREELKDWVHAKDFPSMRSGTNCTWRVDTNLLDAWMIKHGYLKRPNSDLLSIKAMIGER